MKADQPNDAKLGNSHPLLGRLRLCAHQNYGSPAWFSRRFRRLQALDQRGIGSSPSSFWNAVRPVSAKYRIARVGDPSHPQRRRGLQLWLLHGLEPTGKPLLIGSNRDRSLQMPLRIKEKTGSQVLVLKQRASEGFAVREPAGEQAAALIYAQRQAEMVGQLGLI